MKLLTGLFVSLLFVTSLTACGGGGGSDSNSDGDGGNGGTTTDFSRVMFGSYTPPGANPVGFIALIADDEFRALAPYPEVLDGILVDKGNGNYSLSASVYEGANPYTHDGTEMIEGEYDSGSMSGEVVDGEFMGDTFTADSHEAYIANVSLEDLQGDWVSVGGSALVTPNTLSLDVGTIAQSVGRATLSLGHTEGCAGSGHIGPADEGYNLFEAVITLSGNCSPEVATGFATLVSGADIPETFQTSSTTSTWEFEDSDEVLILIASDGDEYAVAGLFVRNL